MNADPMGLCKLRALDGRNSGVPSTGTSPEPDIAMLTEFGTTSAGIVEMRRLLPMAGPPESNSSERWALSAAQICQAASSCCRKAPFSATREAVISSGLFPELSIEPDAGCAPLGKFVGAITADEELECGAAAASTVGIAALANKLGLRGSACARGPAEPNAATRAGVAAVSPREPLPPPTDVGQVSRNACAAGGSEGPAVGVGPAFIVPLAVKVPTSVLDSALSGTPLATGAPALPPPISVAATGVEDAVTDPPAHCREDPTLPPAAENAPPAAVTWAGAG